MSRVLGIHGANAPTIKSKVIEPSDFLIGGIIGQFERKYDKAFLVHNPAEKQAIFGDDISSSWYGSEVVDGFFNNVQGVDAKLYIKSHVGYTGSAIDAVVASSTIKNTDGGGANLLTLQAAYQYKTAGALEYGISGNRTGYTITNGSRFSTTCGVTGSASTDTWIYLTSVSDVKVGDTLKIFLTDGGNATVYKVVTNVNESTGKVDFSGAIHASKKATAADVVQVMGIRIRIYRQNKKGVVSEVDTNLGAVYCSINSQVSDYYVENVFATSSWIDVTRIATSPATPDVDFPADVASVTYLASGADGTTPTTAAHWSLDLTDLNGLPVRMICNPETTTDAIQKAGETYCQGRTDDNPKWIICIPKNQTKAQLITIGNGWQRSDGVLGTMAADWIQITDPFATSSLAPKREIPNAGHVMGCILRTIGLKGIHYIPQKDTPLFGVEGLANSNISTISDTDRTDLANAGVNVIQFVSGYGYIIRNLRTPSTAREFKWLNSMVMRDYIKVSVINSLQPSENEPNSFDNIKDGKDAINNFGYDLWKRGSTGNVKLGETFAQTQNSDGSLTQFTDHYQVIGDITNNPQSSIEAGQRNYSVYFTFPAPTESILISVGIWLRSAT
jgi:hypothetical protein